MHRAFSDLGWARPRQPQGLVSRLPSQEQRAWWPCRPHCLELIRGLGCCWRGGSAGWRGTRSSRCCCCCCCWRGAPEEPAPSGSLCRPTNATLAAESDACPVCVTFTTTICAGYCPSMVRVLPAALPPGPQLVCTYRELTFSSIRLPGCPPGVDPIFSFPVALSCACGSCRLSHSDCGGPRARPHLCTRPHLSLRLL
uniref:Glycoprotein hormone subunit beta domain-containing protein n=1 Tax=Monodelphis domestica TaxID=13616 RepID=F6TWD8_MONDO